MNKKVRICYNCNGHEPCNLSEDSYYSHRPDGFCIWRYTLLMDIQKAKQGIECLTFPDARELK